MINQIAITKFCDYTEKKEGLHEKFPNNPINSRPLENLINQII
jgi:hypothetical protein